MRKLIPILLSLLLLLSVSPAVLAAQGDVLTVTEGQPCTHTDYENGICVHCRAYLPAEPNSEGFYEISNAGQLLWFAELVNSNADELLIDKAVKVDAKLTADIDMTGLPWIPIGQPALEGNSISVRGFGGTFDGCGHTVSGIDCTVTTTGDNSVMASPRAGFFGHVYNATIRDLMVQGSFTAVYTGTSNNPTARAGGIVADTEGSTHTIIENCGFAGTISADGKNMTQVGGIAGYCRATLKNCWSAATVESSGATYQRLGGMIGVDSRGTYENCYYDSTLCDLSACYEGDLSGVTAKTTDQFASGEVAYLLGEPFGQNIDNGAKNEGHPVYSNARVYYGYDSCADDAEIGYTNNSAVSDSKPQHTFSDRGICTVCGGYEPAVLVENVYEISKPGQLLWFALHVNQNRDAWSDSARLVADIDMTGLPWIPIGDPGYDSGIEYKGDFDGNFHTVSGINYAVTSDKSKVCAGFFGQVYRGNAQKRIRNLTVQGSFRAVYTGTGNHTAFCGGIVASMLSAFPEAVAIENCAFIGTLSAESSYRTVIGGIAGGSQYGKVKNCYASAAISAEGTGTNVHGALVGMNADTQNDGLASTIFENCYYNSTVCPLPACGDCEVPGIAAKTASQFASGEVTYLLNASTSEGDLIWKQTIGTDLYPKFTGETVYRGYITCATDAEMGYSNDPAVPTVKPDHSPNERGKCDICGELLGVIRVAGDGRWQTALLVADEMKAALGDEKFDAIIIASGNDFADALAGSYLATVKNAPILLSYSGDNEKYAYLDNDNINYVKENLAEGGKVYILGGEKAVPTLYEDGLEGYDVVRLGGANRFETNILILEEAGITDGSEVLVCTSANFADSLSASATGKPILLVWNDSGALYGSQPEFLEELKEKNCSFTILGGENAVSAKLADEVAKYGEVDRLAGNTRMETSVLVAEKYFDAPETAVLAYAWNYPDGLCGGSLAYALKAPLILTMPKYEQAAVDYAAENDITTGYVLGGDGLIGDAEVRAIFAMAAADQIVVNK